MKRCNKCNTKRCNCKVVINKPVEIITKGKGNDGLSAYELAVLNGYIGTEQEWLESLEGKDGGSYQVDEEDVTVSEDLKLHFKDRDDSKGLGYKILRLESGNTLSSSDFEADTIHEIRYDFDLDGGKLELPENVTLKFNGGSISNGEIVGDNTKIEAGLNKIFEGVEFSGKFTIPYVYPEWFGARGYVIQQITSDFWWTTNDDRLGGLMAGVDSTTAINDAIKLSTISGGATKLSGGQYKITDTIYLPTRYSKLEIEKESAIRTFMEGDGNIIDTYPKEGMMDTSEDREVFSERQIALYSNQAFATESMAIAIHMVSGAELIGGGYLSIANSRYTIGVYIEGFQFASIDMIFNTRVDIRAVGGSTNRAAPAPYDLMMEGWDDEVGEQGDYGYNMLDGVIRQKSSNNTWSSFFANQSEYNTILRTECEGNDVRLINLKINIWGIFGFRGIEMLCSNGGWNNQSVWRGTVSNISNSFITISDGHSAHDMSEMTYQIGNKNSPESRVHAVFGGCSGVHFGNTWDITWFKPPRLIHAFEFSRTQTNNKVKGLDFGSSDGLSFWDFKGDRLKTDTPIIGYNPKINITGDSYGTVYRNLKKYRSYGGNFSRRFGRKFDVYDKLSVENNSMADIYSIATTNYTQSDIDDGIVEEVSNVIYDEDYNTSIDVIDTNNGIYGSSFPLIRTSNRDLGNWAVLLEFRVVSMEGDCWVSFPQNSDNPMIIRNFNFPIINQTGRGGTLRNTISRVISPIYVSNRDVSNNCVVYFHTKSEDCHIELVNVKIISDAGASMDLDISKGPTSNRPDASPKGHIYYDTSINHSVVNTGDSENQVWKEIPTEDAGAWEITSSSGMTSPNAEYSKIGKQVSLSGLLSFSSGYDVDTNVQIVLPFTPKYGGVYTVGDLTFTLTNNSTNANVKSSSTGNNKPFNIQFKTA